MSSIPTAIQSNPIMVNTVAIFVDAESLMTCPHAIHAMGSTQKWDFIMELIESVHEKVVPNMSMITTTAYGNFNENIVKKFNERNIVVKDYENMKKGLDIISAVTPVISHYIIVANDSWVDLVINFLKEKGKNVTLVTFNGTCFSEYISAQEILSLEAQCEESATIKNTHHELFDDALVESVIQIIMGMEKHYRTNEVYYIPLRTKITKNLHIKKNKGDQILNQMVSDSIISIRPSQTDETQNVVILNRRNDIPQDSLETKLTKEELEKICQKCFGETKEWVYASTIGLRFRKLYPDLNFKEIKARAIEQKLIMHNGGSETLQLRLANRR